MFVRAQDTAVNVMYYVGGGWDRTRVGWGWGGVGGGGGGGGGGRWGKGGGRWGREVGEGGKKGVGKRGGEVACK